MANHQVDRTIHPLTFLFRGVFAFALLGASLIITTAPAAAASVGATTTCSNGVDNAGGKGLICDITVGTRSPRAAELPGSRSTSVTVPQVRRRRRARPRPRS